jgi:hypothetical protein
MEYAGRPARSPGAQSPRHTHRAEPPVAVAPAAAAVGPHASLLDGEHGRPLRAGTARRGRPTMSGEGKSESREEALLRFNYTNLHDSFKLSHTIAWTVTGIFLPFCFTLETILASMKLKPLPALTACLATWSLVLVWWLTMRALDRFNEARGAKLREIEDTLNAMPGAGDFRFEQYHLHYTWWANIGVTRVRMNFHRIYGIAFWAATILCGGAFLAATNHYR